MQIGSRLSERIARAWMSIAPRSANRTFTIRMPASSRAPGFSSTRACGSPVLWYNCVSVRVIALSRGR